ncbi:hypothetical protein SAMN04488156_102297 [Bacillus sp. 166amftsu]|nr:hypothetical protein SAMN04488156_102297 [Bacillus sp. 166amftsu]
MEILKRKVKRNANRKELINELSNIVTISMESFMDAESNDLFCKELYSKLEKNSDIKILGDTDYKKNRQLSLELLKETYKNVNFPTNQGRLFFSRDSEEEAVKLNINEIFDNLVDLSIKTQFLTGHTDFILVGDDLEFGVVIERTEYHYEFSIWGVTTV